MSHLRISATRTIGWAVLLFLAVGYPLVAAQNQATEHPSQYAEADIAYGAQIYTAQCSTCHGPQGDGVVGVNLRTGKFRNATTDQDLARIIRTGFPASGMPPIGLDASEMAGTVAYLRNMTTLDASTVKGGDPSRGRIVFEGKAACTRCHRVGAVGSRVAPNLSDIGSIRSAGSLQRSLLAPSSQMMPINRPVRAVTRDGTVIGGRRLNEDTYSVQIIDDRERLLSLSKADLREYTILTTSPMPSYKDTLISEELADVLAYLLSLKGQ